MWPVFSWWVSVVCICHYYGGPTFLDKLILLLWLFHQGGAQVQTFTPLQGLALRRQLPAVILRLSGLDLREAAHFSCLCAEHIQAGTQTQDHSYNLCTLQRLYEPETAF